MISGALLGLSLAVASFSLSSLPAKAPAGSVQDDVTSKTLNSTNRKSPGCERLVLCAVAISLRRYRMAAGVTALTC
jgi:hypothetical protein